MKHTRLGLAVGAALALVFIEGRADADTPDVPAETEDDVPAVRRPAVLSDAVDAPQEGRGPAPPVPPRPRPPMRLRLDGGYGVKRVFSLPVRGAVAGLAIGSEVRPHEAVWAAARALVGTTENGLSFVSGGVGADVDLGIERVRANLGPSLVVRCIQRAVRESWIVRLGLAAHVGVRLNAFRTESASFFVVGEASLDSAGWGGTLGAGLDLAVMRRR